MPAKRLASLFVFGLIFSALLGCQNSPHGILSPTSDLTVAGISPSILMPRDPVTYSASPAVTFEGQLPTFPLVRVFFKIQNGVSAILDRYETHYFATNGSPLAGGKFDHAGALSLFLQADKIGTTGTGAGSGTGSGSGSGTGSSGSTGTTASIRMQTAQETNKEDPTKLESPSDFSLYTTFEVYPPTVYLYMSNYTVSYTDDISPVIAVVSLHGRDLNDHELNFTFNVTLSSTLKPVTTED